MMVDSTVFRHSAYMRDAIDAEASRRVAEAFEEWADQVHQTFLYEMAMHPYSQQSRYASVVEETLRKQADELYKRIEDGIRGDMLNVSSALIQDVLNFASGVFGVPVEELSWNWPGGPFPSYVVDAVLSGKLYENGWNLSKSIWGDEQRTLQDIYRVFMGGIARGDSIFQIAEQLKWYVSGQAYRLWNLRDQAGRRIYPRMVEYNSQRLARTLAQHAYQESLVAATAENPFIEGFIWVANGSRPCQLCQDRDGTFYRKDELPLDHPNGMCVFDPVIDPNTNERLAKWVLEPDGTYPEIDRFAELCGYHPSR